MKKSTCGSSSVGLILSIWHNHGSRLSKSFQWSCIGLIGFFIFSLTIEILPGLGKHLILFFFLAFSFLCQTCGPYLGTLGSWTHNHASNQILHQRQLFNPNLSDVQTWDSVQHQAVGDTQFLSFHQHCWCSGAALAPLWMVGTQPGGSGFAAGLPCPALLNHFAQMGKTQGLC